MELPASQKEIKNSRKKALENQEREEWNPTSPDFQSRYSTPGR